MKKLFTYLLVFVFLSYPLSSFSLDIEQEDTTTLENVDSTAIVAEEVTQEEIETIEDIQDWIENISKYLYCSRNFWSHSAFSWS